MPDTETSPPPAGATTTIRKPEPARRSAYIPPALKLTDTEIEQSFGDCYGPTIGVKEVAEITGLAPATISRKLSEGWCRDCVRRGKPVRFLRNRFIRAFFGGA